MRLPIYAVWSVDWQDDYLREQTGLFARISLGADPRNGDGRHQLHIREAICLETLCEVFDYCRRKDPFVSSYFHPYDLTECGDRLTKRVAQQFANFVRYQRECGVVFLTHLEAKKIYDEGQDFVGG